MGNGPPTYSDLLLLPFVLTVLGLAVYGVITFKSRNDGELSKLRFIGMAIIFIGLIFGLRGAWNLNNPSYGAFYRASLAGFSKRIIVAHYVAGIIPLFALIGIVATDYFVRKAPID